MAQRHRAFGARGFVGGKVVVGLVVEDHAVLQCLDHRHTLVLGGGDHALFRKLNLHVDRAGEERAFGAHALDGSFCQCP